MRTTDYMTRSVMIDIETLDTINEAAIIQIGACNLIESRSFLVSIDEQYYYRNNDQGRYSMSSSTIEWWGTQPDEAKESLRMNLVNNVYTALHLLNFWLAETGFEPSKTGMPTIWANSPTFDLDILEHAYKYEGVDKPWTYRQERCCRTIYSEFSDLYERTILSEDYEKGLVKHRADHDAMRQARSTRYILSELQSAILR